MTNDELLVIVLRALPYSQQIGKLDTTTEPAAIRFNWRGHRFRVSSTLFTEEVEGAFLVSNDLASLAEALFKITYFRMVENKELA